MLSELERAPKVAGAKQVRRALADGSARRVYLAADADPGITGPLAEQARLLGVPVCRADSMKALGRSCGLCVGTAAAAVL